MKLKFEIILPDEVWELFDNIDEKTKTKIIYNIDKSKYVNDPEYLKNLRMIYGNFVLNIGEYIIDYFHSGIKLIKWRHL